MIPENGLETLKTVDEIMLGAVVFPVVPDHDSLWGLLVPIRCGFDQYVCLHPMKLQPNLKIPLALEPEKPSNTWSFVKTLKVNTRAWAEESFPVHLERSSTRLRCLPELAKAQNRKHVTSATKSNGIIHSMLFWDEIFAEIALEYPEIKSEKMHVDALSAKFVLESERFGVLVGSHLFGDILTDLETATVGSIGIGASANLHPERLFPSCFEPVHGSPSVIVGLGVANIWSGALMLEHLDENEVTKHLEQTMNRALESGIKTRDLGGTANIFEVTQAMIAALR
jgi:tartrate dehydrogenase/decarboxylase / D-malate dehydrogenase